ncbi:hypothetical protein GPALN_004917 [Globodera pallida]|nr:hypothetical protein GPALN_004917 [Globodera pallida]
MREGKEMGGQRSKIAVLADGTNPNSAVKNDIKSWAKDLKQQRQARELPELLAARRGKSQKFFGMFGLTVGHCTAAASVLTLQGMLLLEGIKCRFCLNGVKLSKAAELPAQSRWGGGEGNGVERGGKRNAIELLFDL